ncbi:MAG TPA: hypothetical protein VMB72_09815 [Acidimicrobiales bacterium]|nr:hypothetical protein [Acidimicrobiales bacterium]
MAWTVAAVLAATVAGLAAALAGSTSTTPSASAPAPTTTPGRPFGGAGGAGGAAGAGRFAGLGTFGTVASVSSGSFVVTTRQGTSVTVDETATTTYEQGTSSATAAAVVRGARVAVQGTLTGTTVKATRVIVLPAGGFGGGLGFPGGGAAGSTG